MLCFCGVLWSEVMCLVGQTLLHIFGALLSFQAGVSKGKFIASCSVLVIEFHTGAAHLMTPPILS